MIYKVRIDWAEPYEVELELNVKYFQNEDMAIEYKKRLENLIRDAKSKCINTSPFSLQELKNGQNQKISLLNFECWINANASIISNRKTDWLREYNYLVNIYDKVVITRFLIETDNLDILELENLYQ